MGQNEHLAFNEIGSGFGSVTRLVDLNESTRCANVSRILGGNTRASLIGANHSIIATVQVLR